MRPAASDWGVVICYPMGAEHLFSYRGCRQLAIQIARAGFPVLRFDYYGTGDSEGSGEDVSIAGWIEDIGRAAAELRSHGPRLVCVAGLRFGATLASMFADRCGGVDALVLWSPITSGRAYILEHEDCHCKTRAGTPEGELLGYPFPPALREEICGIALPPHGPQPTLLIEPEADSEPFHWLEGAHRVPVETLRSITAWISRTCI